MANIVSQAINEIKSDYNILLTLITAIGQMAFLETLFSDQTDTKTIYFICGGLFCVMSFFSFRYFQKMKNESRYSSKRKIYKPLGFVCAVLALVALLPAAHRWRYLNTDWVPPDKKTQEVEIGKIKTFFIREIQAHSTQGPIEVDMYLDPKRTSLQCANMRRVIRRPLEEAFNVVDCNEYAIIGERGRQIAWGHGIDENDPKRAEFEQKFFDTMMAPTYRAIATIAHYRNKHEPLLERGPEIVFLFSQKSSWKTKLLSVGLLPNADEWRRLEREYPQNALALRRFLVEWIGLLDPFFHVSFRNRTKEPIEVSRILYTATRRRSGSKAELFGAYDVPRYLLELQEGIHEEEIHPPIIISPNGIKEIDLLLRLKQPDPGATYDISITFLSKGVSYQTVMPSFAITFMRGK